METLGSGGDEGRGQDSTTPVSTIQSSRGKRGKKGPAKKAKGQMKVRRKTLNPKKAKKNDRAAVAAAQEEDESAGSDDEKTSHGREVVRRRGKGPSSQHVKDQENGSSDDEGQEGDNEERAVGEKEEEEEWHRLQQDLQKHSKKVFEQAATESHPVHAPYFPEVSLSSFLLLMGTIAVQHASATGVFGINFLPWLISHHTSWQCWAYIYILL